MKPILTLTMNPAIDIAFDVESLDPTGKCRATVRDVVAGGGGINVARAVIELGGEAVALHTAGAEVGSRLERLLGEEAIDHVSVGISGDTREAVVVHESSSGQSYHVVPPGPELTDAEVSAVVEAIIDRTDRHDVVVVSGSLPPGVAPDVHARLADALADSGARLMLDPSGAELPASLDHGVDVVKLNRREAGGLIGGEVRGFDEARRANELILERRWAAIAVTTVGELGAVVSTASAHHEIHTPELPSPARSDAGAGDSFMAGLALGLAQGLDVADAGSSAVAAAAASVITPGTELCRRDDVERLRPHVERVRHDVATAAARPAHEGLFPPGTVAGDDGHATRSHRVSDR